MHDADRPTPIRIALFTLVLVAGLFFRVYTLADKLVWHDEVATRVLSAGNTSDDWKAAIYTGKVVDVSEVLQFQHDNPKRSVAGGIRDLAEHDPQHPPLYYVLARLWVRCVGDGVATLRMLSVFFSVLSFPAMYWLALELSASRRVAWAAVMFSAVSPFFVLYAQEAREYALWGLLTMLSTAALLRAIRESRQESTARRRLWSVWGVYTVCIALGLYTSFTTASVIFVHVLYIVLLERARVTRVSVQCAAALAASGVLFLPWAINMLRQFDAFRASMAWSKVIVIPRSVLLRILSLNVSRTVLDLWPEVDQVTLLAIVVDGLAAALVVAALVYVARRTPRETSLLVLTLVLLPIAMLLVPDLAYGGIRSISGRYMLPAWIGVELALAMFLASQKSDSAWRWVGGAAVLAIGMVSDVSNSRRVAPWTKSVSVLLPDVARAINAAPAPLVVGNAERHHPGNLLALVDILKPGTRMQLLPIGSEEAWVTPPNAGDVFLYSPTDQFRAQLEAREHVHTRLVMKDIFTELWKVERDGVQ
ncbi:MAG: glycosyltransferase family 39 protein [Polyangiales bacterium]